jgi:hypothetical protein
LDLARRSSISLSLAAVSTGLAAPKILTAGTGVGAGAGAGAEVGAGSGAEDDAGSKESPWVVTDSTGFERGCNCNFGLVRDSSEPNQQANIKCIIIIFKVTGTASRSNTITLRKYLLYIY